MDTGTSVLRAGQLCNKKLIICRNKLGKKSFSLSVLKTFSIIYLCTDTLTFFQIPSPEGPESSALLSAQGSGLGWIRESKVSEHSCPQA